jgi:hypothetical protein
MPMLTETRIEIADRHISLCPFAPKAKTALPLGNSGDYIDLYAKAEQGGLDYACFRGTSGKILGKLLPVYKNHKYWKRYLNADPSARDMWSAALPLQATLVERMEVISRATFTAKISPVPRVLIYPFGWSTWISLRISGDHTLEQLADLEEYLFGQKCIRLLPAGASMTLNGFLDHVSQGIRTDAFCGTQTRDASGTSKAIVITVMAKHGGSLSLGALDGPAQNRIKRMVRPEGPTSRRSFDKLAFRVDPESDMNYIVIDELGRFIWMERLLDPEDRNHEWLGCYHQNSFMAMAQAWHFEGLLVEARKNKPKGKPVKEILGIARNALQYPTFINASLRGLLELNSVKNVLT